MNNKSMGADIMLGEELFFYYDKKRSIWIMRHLKGSFCGHIFIDIDNVYQPNIPLSITFSDIM